MDSYAYSCEQKKSQLLKNTFLIFVLVPIVFTIVIQLFQNLSELRLFIL